jgi:DNA polymerase-3 subunit epsilon
MRPAETLLATRAREFLATGPADAVALIEYVCQMPGAPRVVAEHMAEALFAGRREFARSADGRWRMAEVPVRPYVAAVRERLSTLSWVVVDVETTGGRPSAGDRITEYAAVLVRDGEVREVYETLVNPQRPIPPMISALTHITWDMVRDKPTFREVYREVLRTLEGRIFAAHNAGFDWQFVSSELARASGEVLHGRRVCTVRLARRLLPHLPRRSLDYVARHYGVRITARHRAAGDAVATAHVLLHLLRDAAERGCDTWEDLDGLLARGTARARRRGRRRGPPFTDVEPA